MAASGKPDPGEQVGSSRSSKLGAKEPKRRAAKAGNAVRKKIIKPARDNEAHNAKDVAVTLQKKTKKMKKKTARPSEKTQRTDDEKVALREANAALAAAFEKKVREREKKVAARKARVEARKEDPALEGTESNSSPMFALKKKGSIGKKKRAALKKKLSGEVVSDEKDDEKVTATAKDFIGQDLKGWLKQFKDGWGFLNSHSFVGDLFVHSRENPDVASYGVLTEFHFTVVQDSKGKAMATNAVPCAPRTSAEHGELVG
jgi:hypothetical protein